MLYSRSYLWYVILCARVKDYAWKKECFSITFLNPNNFALVYVAIPQQSRIPRPYLHLRMHYSSSSKQRIKPFTKESRGGKVLSIHHTCPSREQSRWAFLPPTEIKMGRLSPPQYLWPDQWTYGGENHVIQFLRYIVKTLYFSPQKVDQLLPAKTPNAFGISLFVLESVAPTTPSESTLIFILAVLRPTAASSPSPRDASKKSSKALRRRSLLHSFIPPRQMQLLKHYFKGLKRN